jgi:hypothetical protein|tara:strand:- start:868 stop:1080 length:213 start_codon:yes stop_codon:yes gene_type:complete|eukprot:31376-Pelagococcus_subviridis.AAC.9
MRIYSFPRVDRPRADGVPCVSRDSKLDDKAVERLRADRAVCVRRRAPCARLDRAERPSGRFPNGQLIPVN